MCVCVCVCFPLSLPLSLSLALSQVHSARDHSHGVAVAGGSHRCRAKREQLQGVQELLPESQGHDLAVTVLYVPCSLDSG